MNYLIRAIVTVSVLLLVNQTALSATEWNMLTPYGESVHHTKNILAFAKDVKKLSNNELELKIYSGATLFKHWEIHEAVRIGQVPIGELLMGSLGDLDEIFKVDNIPFLATDFVSARKLWKSSKPEVERSLSKAGLKLLFAVPWPPQGIFSKHEIINIEDLVGANMRSYSPTLSRLSELLIATPTTVQTPEIPQAFSTGLVDAMITSPTTGVSSQAWKYVSYYSDVQAWIPKNLVIVRSKSYDRLPESTKNALLQASAIAEKRGWKLAQDETKLKMESLTRNGIRVTKPSPKLKSDLAEVGEIMTKEWSQKTGKRAKTILDDYFK